MKNIFIILYILFSTFNLKAQWSNNPILNTAVSIYTGNQSSQNIVSDGLGGAIITWQDQRNGTGTDDIYAQRINASGVAQWTADGVSICVAGANQQFPTIVSDGSGGAIITWYDGRNGFTDIYAQHVNASGMVQWTNDGVAICLASGNQYSPVIETDGSGGAIIAWLDVRNGSNYDIYAQRVNSLGIVQWTANGVGICIMVGDQKFPNLVSDGVGGAIITWQDQRSGSGNEEIYAKRINSLGILQWTPNGVAICTAPSGQYYPVIASDGSGGAIITWYDYRTGTSSDIYAQRINSSGATQWTLNGVAVSIISGTKFYPTIVSDEFGGAIIAWSDNRNGNTDIYAQRLNSLGASQWTNNGIAICTATNTQNSVKIISDNLGGAIVTWQDYRGGINWDIYTQRLNSIGLIEWLSNGVLISEAANSQNYPSIITDGSGGAIMTWADFRNGMYYDIYAQNICANGVTGVTPLGIIGPINGANNICEGSINIYSITPIPDATSYNWILSSGLTGTSSSSSVTSMAGSTNGSIGVTVSNACGTSSTIINVSVNTLPTIAVNSGSICAGQSFTMVPTGAATYTYSNGSDIVSPTADATYSVSGTDANGCVSSTDAISGVTVNALPTITVNSGAICAGQSFTMVPSGASTYTYSNGTDVVMPTADATYSVIGTDANGCTPNVDAVSSVTVNALPVLITSTTNTLLCTGETTTLSVTGAISYTWSTTDNTTDIIVSPTVQTTYTVDGTDYNGCVNSTTIMQDVSLCTSINSLIVNQNSHIVLYPNPNNGSFNIELNVTSQISITNAMGQFVLTETMKKGKHNLDIQNQSNGIYFIKVIQDGKEYMFKFIKE